MVGLYMKNIKTGTKLSHGQCLVINEKKNACKVQLIQKYGMHFYLTLIVYYVRKFCEGLQIISKLQF